MNIKSQRRIFLFFLCCLVFTACSNQANKKTATSNIERRVDSVLDLMTLEEKIGQLNQLRGNRLIKHNVKDTEIDIEQEVRSGRIGSFLNVDGLEHKIKLQKIAVEETRLGIPLVIAMDVIHGYKTIFPVPLAEAASWDTAAMRQAARIAATEASAEGYHWTFAPMVDISRDARWGRVMEGAGEDPFLGSCIAAARVKGFQGDNLADNNTILSCAKHLAAYGQVEAAKEYNQTTISERYLRTVVLPPFKAACDAGAATVMNAFNDFDGIPCSGNKFLVTDILKNEWGFKGFTISDYNSFEEMINWRVVKDRKGAAELAMNAASDMDMMSMVYVDHLGELVEEGKISEEQIDASVRRILSMKFKLGLFDDPYKYFDEKRRDSLLLHPGHRKAAREMAQKSMVLLKNKNNLLPLAKNKYKTIAVIGPSAHNRNTLKGNWMGMCDTNDVVTILEGIKNKVDKTTKVLYAWGCNEYEHTSDKAFNNALETAQKADLVILAIGENWWMSGEGASRADINLGGRQTELAKAIKKQGKPVVTVLINGRPVIFHWIKNNIPAILEAWLPGTEGGDAVADILFGDYNPAGKLPVTFPYHVGQIPVYYSYKETGRPFRGEAWGVARYQDIPNTPLYPFGYGLSYTTFQYSGLKLNKQTIGFSDTLTVSVEITNTGNYKGVEIVQLYISDLVASVTPPVKLLKGFKRVSLEPGETKKVIFNISTEQLKYWNKNMEYKADPGEFEVMAGTNSDEGKKALFILK